MSLHKWLSERRLRKHQSSPEEIRDLLRVVERDFADAALESLSADRRRVVQDWLCSNHPDLVRTE